MPAGPFYRTKDWHRLRARALRAQPLCPCGAKATNVDHIQPRPRGAEGLTALDVLSNTQTLCHACHSRKTARLDGGFGNAPSRKKPIGKDGWPLEK